MTEIQGMDTIPQEIAKGEWGDEIKRWLPSWDRTGEYNYRPGATTQMATAQLEILMQNGSHLRINNAMQLR